MQAQPGPGCPKCGGEMDEGRLTQTAYISNRQQGMIRQGTNISHARACVSCGYVELYVDPAELRARIGIEVDQTGAGGGLAL